MKADLNRRSDEWLNYFFARMHLINDPHAILMQLRVLCQLQTQSLCAIRNALFPTITAAIISCVICGIAYLSDLSLDLQFFVSNYKTFDILTER